MTEAFGLAQALTRADGIVRSATASADCRDAVTRLAQNIGSEEIDLVTLFVSTGANVARVTAEATKRLALARVVGCTTAGELSFPATPTETSWPSAFQPAISASVSFRLKT